MRKVAILHQPIEGLVRLMLYGDEHGAYLFGYNSLADSSSVWDDWYETVTTAEEVAFEEYKVTSADWQIIAEPLPDCQHDWIAPVRVQGRSEGNPQWGCLETLIDGQ
jgi:hypothetical protein